LWADPAFQKTHVLKHGFGSGWKSATRTIDYNIFFNALIFFGRNIDPDTLPGKSVLSQG